MRYIIILYLYSCTISGGDVQSYNLSCILAQFLEKIFNLMFYLIFFHNFWRRYPGCQTFPNSVSSVYRHPQITTCQIIPMATCEKMILPPKKKDSINFFRFPVKLKLTQVVMVGKLGVLSHPSEGQTWWTRRHSTTFIKASNIFSSLM